MTTYRTKVRVTAILEHSRTIRGRRDSLGQATTETVNLGWFLHLSLNDEVFGIALGLGSEKPDDISVGDELTLTLKKEE